MVSTHQEYLFCSNILGFKGIQLSLVYSTNQSQLKVFQGFVFSKSTYISLVKLCKIPAAKKKENVVTVQIKIKQMRQLQRALAQIQQKLLDGFDNEHQTYSKNNKKKLQINIPRQWNCNDQQPFQTSMLKNSSVLDCQRNASDLLLFIKFYFKSKLMEQIMEQLENKPSWKDSMRKCCRSNKLNIELASAYTPLRFRASYARFKAIYQRRSQDKGQRWLENQLKAFEWLVVALSCTTEVKIKDFGPTEIEKLFEVFYFKQLLTIDYEVKKLSEDPMERQNWDMEEQTLLTDIILELSDNNNRWNEYARKLYESSQKKYFRTGKQCRQRWLNHLDPNKKHGDWTQEEDFALAQLFLTEGKKWSHISKKLGGSRTEHMIKNRYKTIISRQRRSHPEIRSDYNLLKSILNLGEGKKQMSQIEEVSEKTVKAENKSEEIIQREDVIQRVQEDGGRNVDAFLLPGDGDRNKNLPQTSSVFQAPHVFSPWVMSYQMTPTFSPFFVNVPTFSSFDANFSNQFYCPGRNDQEQ